MVNRLGTFRTGRPALRLVPPLRPSSLLIKLQLLFLTADRARIFSGAVSVNAFYLSSTRLSAAVLSVNAYVSARAVCR